MTQQPLSKAEARRKEWLTSQDTAMKQRDVYVTHREARNGIVLNIAIDKDTSGDMPDIDTIYTITLVGDEDGNLSVSCVECANEDVSIEDTYAEYFEEA